MDNSTTGKEREGANLGKCMEMDAKKRFVENPPPQDNKKYPPL